MRITFYVTSDFSIIILDNYFIHNNHLLNFTEYSSGYILFLELHSAVFFIFFIELYLFGYLIHFSTFFHYISDWSSGYYHSSSFTHCLNIDSSLRANLFVIIPSFLCFLILSLRQSKLLFIASTVTCTVDCQVYILNTISFQSCPSNYLLVTSA